jgi:3-methyladenine DNA glycosylase AlkC
VKDQIKKNKKKKKVKVWHAWASKNKPMRVSLEQPMRLGFFIFF